MSIHDEIIENTGVTYNEAAKAAKDFIADITATDFYLKYGDGVCDTPLFEEFQMLVNEKWCEIETEDGDNIYEDYMTPIVAGLYLVGAMSADQVNEVLSSTPEMAELVLRVSPLEA